MCIRDRFRNMVKNRTMDNGVQYERGMTNAFVWADDSIQPEEPGLLSCEAVSYTHLDVYKRQAMMISFASGELIHQFSRATAWSMLPPWLGMHQLMASRR